MIEKKEIIRILRRMKLEHGPTVCLGCGHEHNCSIHGCAVLNDAIAMLSLQDPRLVYILEKEAFFDVCHAEEAREWFITQLKNDGVAVVPSGFRLKVIDTLRGSVEVSDGNKRQ